MHRVSFSLSESGLYVTHSILGISCTKHIAFVCVWGGEEYMTRAIFLSAHYRYHSSINAVAKVIPNHIAFFAFLSRPTFAAGPLLLADHFIHSWFVKKHVDFNPAAKHQNKHKFEG